MGEMASLENVQNGFPGRGAMAREPCKKPGVLLSKEGQQMACAPEPARNSVLTRCEEYTI